MTYALHHPTQQITQLSKWGDAEVPRSQKAMEQPEWSQTAWSSLKERWWAGQLLPGSLGSDKTPAAPFPASRLAQSAERLHQCLSWEATKQPSDSPPGKSICLWGALCHCPETQEMTKQPVCSSPPPGRWSALEKRHWAAQWLLGTGSHRASQYLPDWGGHWGTWILLWPPQLEKVLQN